MATYTETVTEQLGPLVGYGEEYSKTYGGGLRNVNGYGAEYGSDYGSVEFDDQLLDSVTVEYFARPATREVANFSDTATTAVTFNLTIREVAQGNDVATPRRAIPATASEVAEFVDVATANVTFLIREVANFVDSATTQRTTASTLREVAEFVDVATPLAVVVASETAEFVDSVSALRLVRATLTEAAEFTDAALSPIESGVVVTREVAQANETAVTQLTTSPLASEEAFITDSLYLNDADGGYVWTALTTTWAMSRYVGTPFTSMLDDFAATNDALLLKDGGFGDADVLTGDSDLMSQDLKRVRALHMYGEHASPLTVSVTADVKGLRNTSSYTQMARDASDVRAVRCTFGRGFKSQCYQIGAQSQGYARMRAWVPFVDSTRRRI